MDRDYEFTVITKRGVAMCTEDLSGARVLAGLEPDPPGDIVIWPAEMLWQRITHEPYLVSIVPGFDVEGEIQKFYRVLPSRDRILEIIRAQWFPNLVTNYTNEPGSYVISYADGKLFGKITVGEVVCEG